MVVRRFDRPRSAHLVGVGVAVLVSAIVAVISLAGSHLLGVGLFLLAATWVTAYATVWIAYRRRTSVALTLPGLVVIIVALAFLPASFHSRVLFFTLAAAPAVGLFRYRVNVAGAVNVSSGGPAIAATIMISIVMLAMWVSPASGISINTGLLDGARQSISESWISLTKGLFGDVPNRRVIPSIRLTDSLPFVGPLELNDDAMLLVTASKPRRWRMATYEVYTSEGWTTSSTQSTAGGELSATPPGAATLDHRTEVRVAVRTQGIMDEVATAGIPFGSTIDSVMNVSKTPLFEMELDTTQAVYLPKSVAAVRDALVRNSGDDVASAITDAGLVQTGGDDSRLVLQRAADDIAPRLGLEFAQHLVPPRTYESVGHVSVASAVDLRGAGREYPLPISDRYLQLPIDFPERVRAQALELAEGWQNPYDIAVSVQAFLRTIPYSTTIQAPPEGVDAVEWFIFENHVGFCNYYASAMITMLRSLGIPARLAVGFAPGDFDRERGVWVVEARHYHAWPEVYFPNLGWVEFEPTNSAVQRSLALLNSPSPVGSGGIATPGDIAEDCPSGVEDCSDIAVEGDLSDAGVVPPAPTLDRDFGSWLALGASIAVLAMLFSGAVYVLRLGSQALSSPAGRAFLLLRWLGRVTEGGRRASETPLEFGERLAARLPRYAGAIREIAFAYTFHRYAGGDPPAWDEVMSLRKAVATTRRAALAVPFTQLPRLWSWLPLGRSLPRSGTRRA